MDKLIENYEGFINNVLNEKIQKNKTYTLRQTLYGAENSNVATQNDIPAGEKIKIIDIDKDVIEFIITSSKRSGDETWFIDKAEVKNAL